MPIHVKNVTRIQAAGNKPKLIDEIIGRVNTNSKDISVAHMRSPSGWVEPGQTPKFDEYTYVLNGELCVKTKDSLITVLPGQAIITKAGEWVQYSTPHPQGAEYIAICLPAFSPDTVCRDA